VDLEEREYIESLFPDISRISDPDIREKVCRAWVESWRESNYEKIEDLSQWEPQRDKVNWCNVDHTNEVTRCAIATGQLFEEMYGVKVNMDYIIAGAVLHDVDKLILFDAKTHMHTALGEKFAHATYGSHQALAVGLPRDVAHIIGSHSPHYSNTEARTVEAIIVRNADHVIAEGRNTAFGCRVDFRPGK
jgi:7,8-dihydroneopterin 2',3'-cyclic phosphate phosphodiesterase